MNPIDTIITVSAHPDLKAELTPFGAGLYQLYFKGKELLASGTKEEYFRKNNSFYGQTVAPFAGRVLHGKIGSFSFKTNEGPNCLHSGSFTTAFSPFAYELKEKDDRTEVLFHHEQDVEGVHLVTETTYTFYKDAPRFAIRIDVTSDKVFPRNPTHHAYWYLGAKNLCDFDIRMKATRRVDYGEAKHPIGFIPAAGDFEGDRLKVDATLDYGYLLDDPKIEMRVGNILLTATSKAKAVLVYTGHPGPRPCATLEFVDAPLNDDAMLKSGTSTVLAEYTLEEK